MTILNAKNYNDAEDRAIKKFGKSGYSKIIDISSVDQLKRRKLGEDRIPGGKGDNKTNKSFDFNELVMGTKVEMEHTKDPKKAKEIAKDHLTEDPEYYSKLKKAGLADELKEKNMANEVTRAEVKAVHDYLSDPRHTSAEDLSRKFDLSIEVAEALLNLDLADINRGAAEDFFAVRHELELAKKVKKSNLKEHHNREFPKEILDMSLGQFLDHLVGLSPSDPKDVADKLYRSIEKFIQDNLEFLKDPSKFPSEDEEIDISRRSRPETANPWDLPK